MVKTKTLKRAVKRRSRSRFAVKGRERRAELRAERRARVNHVTSRSASQRPKRSRKAVTERDGVTEGSGNVFADIGLPQPERELTKARLTLTIYRIIRDRGLTQTQAAKVLGVQQPQVSLLMRNRAGTFSVDRLLEFLTALGQDVEINVHKSRRDHGALLVNVA